MSRVTILIVDDDPDQHAVCGAFLEHAGYAVLHAFDGQEGVERGARAAAGPGADGHPHAADGRRRGPAGAGGGPGDGAIPVVASARTC